MDGETINSDKDKQLRNEMLFTLSERDSGTLATIVTENKKQQKELYQFLKDHLNEYKFYDLDLTSHHYTSLYKALQELLPVHVLHSSPVEYFVNVTGLENSVYKTKDGRIEYSDLIAQLNFERELLFGQPYIIVLWISTGFDKELQKKAPDLMHWLSKRFVFEAEPERLEVAEEAIRYGTIKKQGKIQERIERISHLQETWEKLSLHHEDQERIIKDKIQLLLLLGKEYRASFDFIAAEDALKRALVLNDRIEAGSEAELFFELATLYLEFSRFKPAQEYYKKALEYYERTGNEYAFGNTYHQLGRAYQAQRQWKESLENYRKALECYEKTGNEYELGGTYHQLGMIYEDQHQWKESLENYSKALECKERTGNEYALGSTYHQLGMVYQLQRQWKESLENYNKALEWKKKTGNEYALGSTYHQLGMVYEEQREWKKSLENYRKALEWKERTGNEYTMGNTYHQLGKIHQEQREWKESLENYNKALECDERTGNEYAVGNTYHQLGRMYEEQEDFINAKVNFETAIKYLSQYNHPGLEMALASLDRVKNKVK